MKRNRETLVALSFIILCAGSSIYLISVTLNYLNYYPAIENLSAQVNTVSVVQGSNWSRIDSQITISNPSGYYGFRLAEASISMYFQVNSSATLFADLSLESIQTLSGQLGPNSVVHSDILTRLNPDNATALKNFNASYPGKVMAVVSLTVYVITFLDPVFGRLPIGASANLPLVTGPSVQFKPQSLTSTNQFSIAAKQYCHCWKSRT